MKIKYVVLQTIIILSLLFTGIGFAQEDEDAAKDDEQTSENNVTNLRGADNIDSVINLVTTGSVGSLTKELTGYTETTIGGSPYTIDTRYANTPSNKKAAQYIYEKLNSYGVTASYDNYSANSTNVIGKKTGSVYPNQMYIICCHFDDVPAVTESKTAPGADDNGSGVVGILESARLLADYDLKYTVLFIAFDESVCTLA
ncbi:MAG: M28 family metallopeptidase [Candidatus Paceibacterales bacterium]